MEPIPSLRVLKYLFYDRFSTFYQQKKRMNPHLRNIVSQQLAQYHVNLSLEQSLMETTFTVFDLETTGFYPKLGDEIVSVGAIKMNVNEIKFPEHFYEIVSPIGEVPNNIYSLTGLSEEQVSNGKTFDEVFSKFLKFSEGTVLVAHPASFDVNFLQVMAKRWQLGLFQPTFIDSYYIANYLRPKKNNKLDGLVSYFNIENKQRHHALNDAQMTAEVFTQLLYLLQEKGIDTLGDYLKLRGKKKGDLLIK
ncbi:hypothetical protein BKP35_09555 [Anaerobacillus arseniciselenatis]|uniref:Exonuclease domain-containing protein n=1 Tax=Anaerobacillus arseniciselenatis TaxID=85682 RepID=A0A1S2LK60_9BACI|nr:exonuclease domain-containing protein [Anaerobacillus arseniciselenatis]OIJ12811.1 hypothetical protein BKP35_09555 [Anaerobacillus arseniciselenatis]